MDDDLLTLDEIAQLIGVTRHSIARYKQRANKNRAAGIDRIGDMPTPDRMFGRSPAWRRSAILAWDSAREKRPAQRKANA